MPLLRDKFFSIVLFALFPLHISSSSTTPRVLLLPTEVEANQLAQKDCEDLVQRELQETIEREKLESSQAGLEFSNVALLPSKGELQPYPCSGASPERLIVVLLN